MRTTLIWMPGALRSAVPNRVRAMAHDDRGEGVISAAIAVLIMAFLGALMWVGFQKMWTKTEDRTNQQIDHISSDR